MMRPIFKSAYRALLCWLAMPALALAADPQIASFEDSPVVVIAGGVYSYVIRVDNTAADDALNTRLRLTVPSGAVFVSASPASQACAPTSPTVVECNLQTLGGNGADARDITISWRATAAGPSTISATAQVLTDSADVNLSNNSQPQETTVDAGSNLSLLMTGSPDPASPGSTVTYTLTAANAGPNVQTSLTIRDNLPPTSTYVSASGSGWSCSHAAGVVTCTTTGAFAVGASIPPVTITTTTTASSGTIENSATVSGAIADPDTADNTVTVRTTVQTGADVQLTSKSVVSATPISTGSNVTFRLTPRNAGPEAASNVTLTDVLPAGWTFVSATGTGWSCSAAGQTVTCTRATLAVGVANDVDIVARAPATASLGGTSHTNSAQALAASPTDPIPTNNSASVNAIVYPAGADLGLSKVKTPIQVAVGGALSSAITVTNNGPLAATGTLRVVEVLSNEAYVGFSGTGWACTAASATTVVCNYAGANLAVGASLPVLTLNTTASAAGTSVNTACTGSSVPSGAAAGTTASPPTQGDPNISNDCASDTSYSADAAGNTDLSIPSVITSTPTGGDKVLSGTESSATFTVRATNLGPAAATGAYVSFRVPNEFLVGRSGLTVSVPAVGDSNGVANGSTATFSCTLSAPTGVCTQQSGSFRTGDWLIFSVTITRPMIQTWGTNYGVFSASIWNSVEFDTTSTTPATSLKSNFDTLQIDPLADVEVTGKTVTPSTVLAGENATYVVSFRNNGPDDAYGVTLNDAFSFFAADGVTANASDPGLTVVSFSNSKAGTTCQLRRSDNSLVTLAAGLVITPADRTVECPQYYLESGEEATVTFVVRPASQSANPTRIIRNTATVGTSSVESATGGDNGNNSRTATLTVLSNAIDLVVDKTDAVDPVPFVSTGGTFIDYRIRVTSRGPSFGTNVRVTESMVPPAGKRIRFVCDATALASGVCNAISLCQQAGGASANGLTSTAGAALPSFSCAVPAGTSTTGLNVGELSSGQFKDIFLRYEVLDQPPAAGDVYVGTASVASNEVETLVANNVQEERTTTRNLIDIRVTKSASQSSVSVSQPFTWTVTVRNQGPGDSLQTDLTDNLPAGSVITGAINWTRSAPSGSGTCTSAGLTISCALGRLNAGGIATVTVPTRIDAYPSGGTATNTATVDTASTKTGAEDFPGGNNTGTATVTVSSATLSGTVFEDRDRSGSNGGTPQAAATEPRMAGVTITLTGTDQFGAAVNRSTLTDAAGNYSFADLNPSDASGYTVTQTQPAAYVNSPVSPPASGLVAPSAGGTYDRGGLSSNSQYVGVVVGLGVSAVNYNFPEVRRVSLAGFVYLDSNNSGVREAGVDTPIAGATVRLLDASGATLVSSTTSGADGSYAFTNLDPTVVYTLEEPLPTVAGALQNGPVNPGLIGGAACASGCAAQPDTPSAGTDRIAQIDLSAGLDGSLFNFGERNITAISGTVYTDRDLNNVLDAATDGRVSGVVLSLYAGGACSGTPLATTTSDANGNYAFAGLTAGQTYTICETQPAGYADGATNPGTSASSGAANAITVTNLPSTGSGSNHFGERLGALAGTVYLDANNDGVRQAGEAGISGVTVTLAGSDIAGALVNRTATTDASGNFRFDDVLASNGAGYSLTEQGAQPVVSGVATLNGRTTAGTVGGLSTGSATATGSVPSGVGGIVLPAGGVSENNLFGEILPVSVNGVVFADANNNGLQDVASDVGLSGVTLQLTGTDDTGAAVSRSTSSQLDGSFAFTDLRPGTYTVTEPNQPPFTSNGQTVAGTAGGSVTSQATLPSAISGIVLTLPGAASNDNRFAEIPDAGVISGRVWFDADNDGLLDATESGISAQTLQLTGTTAAGVTVSLSVITGADGSYAFSGLPPGTYSVSQPVQPAGTFNGQTLAGTAGGTATGLATLPSAINGIVLGAGASSLNNNFAETGGSAISGRVWLDVNDNGAIDAGEAGIAGVGVSLTGTNDQGAGVSLTTTTGADGSFLFGNLRPGSYALTQGAQPAGTLSGRTLAGSGGGTVTSPAVVASRIDGIVLLAGQTAADNLFGEIPPARLAGRVWLDANDNGSIEGSETGLSGVTVNLSGTDDQGVAVTATVNTGADGSYAFENLRPGNYSLVEPAQPANTTNGQTVPGSAGGAATAVNTTPSAIAGIVLRVGQAGVGNNFGERSDAQISGRVWLDVNDNGVVDTTETGLSNVAITLTGTDDAGSAVNRSTTTASDGSFSFVGLRAGSYALAEPGQPSGTLNGRTVAGTLGGTATTASTAPSAITGIVLGSGQVSANNLFGEILPAQLAGRVWLDGDNDAVIDSGEGGIAGVTLTLTGTDDLGVAVSQSLQTGADGSYAFENLRPGNYVLTEPSQPPATANGQTVAGSVGGTASAVGETPSSIRAIALPASTSATGYNFAEVPDSADLWVRKAHEPAVLTAGLTGAVRIQVRNGGSLPTNGSYTVTDVLPGGLSLAGAPSGNGWSCTGAVGDTRLSCTSSVVLPAGDAHPGDITVRVAVAANAAATLQNAVRVEGGGESPWRGPSPAERDATEGDPSPLPLCTNPATHNACRDAITVQQPAALSGTVWTDSGSAAKLLDDADRRMPGWLVEVTNPASGVVVGRATTDGQGAYRVPGLEPGVPLVVRFRDPVSGVVFGYPVNGETAPGSSGASCTATGQPPAGQPSSCPRTSPNPELAVVLVAGAELPQQSLPIDPSGVVYDAVRRTAVPGAIVTLAPAGVCVGWDPASQVVGATLGGYVIDGSAIGMTVGADGFYQFLLSPSAPPRCNFSLSVTPPADYAFPSQLIAPDPSVLNPPGGPAATYLVQPQATPPTGPVGPGTVYHLNFIGGSAAASIVHNHIPLDPLALGALSLTKTGDRAVAEIGDSVRYTLTVSIAAGGRPIQTTLVDRLPAGFTYIAGTATVNDQPLADPVGAPGPDLVFNLGAMPASQQLVLRYRVRVGVGAQQGDGINRAQAHACQIPTGCVDAARNPLPSAASTNQAQFRVRVQGGVFTTDACVLGKVFVDCNLNHLQDPEELGIPGVRLVLSDGTTLISDVEGKYSMCGLSPRSHVLRADPSTLPRGARLTTSSNRNLADAGSLWLDLKMGELHRADFIEGSCSNTVLEQVKARRAQGEVRSVETEKKGGPALRFDSKAHGLDTLRSPQQGTDGANQLAPKARDPQAAPSAPAQDETHVPTSQLPMNQPPPKGRQSGDAPGSASTAGSANQGGANGQR
jgi:uncharacterized repeat protein (TIGR01451 family)